MLRMKVFTTSKTLQNQLLNKCSIKTCSKILSCGLLKVSSQLADVWNRRSWVLVLFLLNPHTLKQHALLDRHPWNESLPLTFLMKVLFFYPATFSIFLKDLVLGNRFQGDQANLPFVTSLRGFAFKVPLEESHKPSLTWATHMDSDDISL